MKYKTSLIIRARALKGWTQADLARAVDRDPGTISKIENGQIEGNPQTMKRIADVLGISMEDIVEELTTA